MVVRIAGFDGKTDKPKGVGNPLFNAYEITLDLPKAASEADIVAGVKAVIAEMGTPTMKQMGTVMKNAMAKFAAQGMRVDGKVVSEAVKKELEGK